MDRLITSPEAARRLKINEATLRSWRLRGKGPPYVQPGGWGTATLYDPKDVTQFKRDLRRKEKINAGNR